MKKLMKKVVLGMACCMVIETGLCSASAKEVRAESVNCNGSCVGFVTKTYAAKPASTSIASLKNVNGGKIQVTFSKKSSVTGYQIQYSTSSKFDKNVKSVKVLANAKNNKTIDGLSKGKKYYIRIRTYKTAKKSTSYSSWSSVKSITTSGASVDANLKKYVGTYKIDDTKTVKENKNTAMTTMFGSSYKYGNELVVKSNKEFSYYIGVGHGGKGTCSYSKNTISYNVKTYTEKKTEKGKITIKTIGKNTYLVMKIDSYSIYWVKSK